VRQKLPVALFGGFGEQVELSLLTFDEQRLGSSPRQTNALRRGRIQLLQIMMSDAVHLQRLHGLGKNRAWTLPQKRSIIAKELIFKRKIEANLPFLPPGKHAAYTGNHKREVALCVAGLLYDLIFFKSPEVHTLCKTLPQRRRSRLEWVEKLADAVGKRSHDEHIEGAKLAFFVKNAAHAAIICLCRKKNVPCSH
jgi:hypothetical protein